MHRFPLFFAVLVIDVHVALYIICDIVLYYCTVQTASSVLDYDALVGIIGLPARAVSLTRLQQQYLVVRTTARKK